MTDIEVIENLVDFLCENGMYTSFVNYMTEKGYDVVENEDSNYIIITE